MITIVILETDYYVLGKAGNYLQLGHVITSDMYIQEPAIAYVSHTLAKTDTIPSLSLIVDKSEQVQMLCFKIRIR